MATFTEELIGVHNLVGGNDYIFSLPSASPLGQPFSNSPSFPVEEVYINCDITLGGINILLPSINTLNGIWNLKIYVCLTAGIPSEAGTVVVYPFAGSEIPSIPNDTLNGSSSVYFTGTYETYYFHAVAPHMWMALNCPPPILPPL